MSAPGLPSMHPHDSLLSCAESYLDSISAWRFSMPLTEIRLSSCSRRPRRRASTVIRPTPIPWGDFSAYRFQRNGRRTPRLRTGGLDPFHPPFGLGGDFPDHDRGNARNNIGFRVPRRPIGRSRSLSSESAHQQARAVLGHRLSPQGPCAQNREFRGGDLQPDWIRHVIGTTAPVVPRQPMVLLSSQRWRGGAALGNAFRW